MSNMDFLRDVQSFFPHYDEAKLGGVLSVLGDVDVADDLLYLEPQDFDGYLGKFPSKRLIEYLRIKYVDYETESTDAGDADENLDNHSYILESTRNEEKDNHLGSHSYLLESTRNEEQESQLGSRSYLLGSRTVTLEKNEFGLLGFAIVWLSENSVHVNWISLSGPASQDGDLQIGDKILAVNRKNTRGMYDCEVQKIIQQIWGPVTLTVVGCPKLDLGAFANSSVRGFKV